MMVNNVKIDGVKIENRLKELASAGLYEGQIWRASYTIQEKKSKDLFTLWFKRAGMAVKEDSVGNIYGTIDCSSARYEQKPILTGSHLDTVKNGGKYDGAAGIVCSLVAVEVLVDKFGPPKIPIEVVGFVEEEGSRFPEAAYWGSRALAGEIEKKELQYKDQQNVSLYEAMVQAGYDPNKVPDSHISIQDYSAYLELHIEQGAVLESQSIHLGIVDTIAGFSLLAIEILGRADHAGTTPMNLRLDALQGACQIVKKIPSLVNHFPKAVATIGTFELEPGSSNVVPEKVSFLVDIRAALDQDLLDLEQLITKEAKALIDQGFTVNASCKVHVSPVELDRNLRDIIYDRASELGIPSTNMISGAAHDCQVLAKYIPASLLFIPSYGGRSHCPEEYTSISDLITGTKMLAAVLYHLAW